MYSCIDSTLCYALVVPLLGLRSPIQKASISSMMRKQSRLLERNESSSYTTVQRKSRSEIEPHRFNKLGLTLWLQVITQRWAFSADHSRASQGRHSLTMAMTRPEHCATSLNAFEILSAPCRHGRHYADVPPQRES